MRSRSRLHASWLGPSIALAAALGACGAPPHAVAPPRTTSQEEAPATFVSPAHWAYFPREAGLPTATFELPGHQCVVLTDSGERWLIRGTASAPCKGVATASSSPAYEALVGVLASNGEYQFIAQSGTVYVATEPLGAFVRYFKPPRPLHQVASAKGAIVGVDDAGSAYYFTADATSDPKAPDPKSADQKTDPKNAATKDSTAQSGSWKQATQPAGSQLFAVGIDDKGRAIAIGVPETIYTSLDGGKTFSVATGNGGPRPPHVGAVAVTRSKKGELAVEGVMGSLIWEESGGFSRSTEPLAASSVSGATIEPSATPGTTAIREGRGVVTGDRYYDLRYPDGYAGPDDGSGAPYVLARGPLGGPLETKHLSARKQGAFTDCTEMHLSAHGKNVVLTCSHPLTTGTDMGVSLFVSFDAGERFDAVGELVTPSFSEMAMAVGGDGTLLVTNVCRPGGEKRKHKEERPESEGCKPRGPIVVRVEAGPKAPEKPAAPSANKLSDALAKKSPAHAKPETSHGGELHATFVQGNAPQLTANAFGPAIGAEGRYYFLGRRKKDDRPSIFVSSDQGRTYEAHAVEAPTQDAAPSPDDASGSEPEVSYTNLDFSNDAHLTVDDAGTLGFACDSSAGYTWVTADSEGRVASVSGAPEQGAALGGWGRRVVSVGYGAQDGVIRAWESGDGGQSFNEITTTAAVGNYFNGDTMIACDAGGCLLGETLARIGWEGQAETSMNVVEDFPAALEPRLRPAIACELSPKSKWTAVKNLGIGADIYPRLEDVARGSSAWAVMTRDPESGEVDVTSASLSDKPQEATTVQTHVILNGQSGAKGRIASLAKKQFEGFVAAKAVVPEAKGRFDAGKPVDDLEVGWVNFYTGTWGKRTLRAAGTWTTSLASGTALTPSLLTIAGPGVVFRAGALSKSLFFDANAKTTVFDYPDWTSLGITGLVNTSDAAFVGGQVFAIGFVDRPPIANVFVTAHKPNGAASYQAEAITYGQGTTDVGWIYLGAENGVSAVNANVDRDAADASAWILQPDGGLGERITLPTLRDVGDKPRPCTAEDRKTTPRMVAAAFSQRGALLYRSGRQPIQVTEGGASPKSLVASEPIWFLSDGAVLHGTKKDPCVAGIRGSAIRHGSVIVIAGDMDHAWMFRPSAMTTPSTPICNCNPDDPLCQCPEPTPTDPKKKQHGGRSSLSSVEFRAMTCKSKPELVPPYELGSMALVRAPEDVP